MYECRLVQTTLDGIANDKIICLEETLEVMNKTTE